MLIIVLQRFHEFYIRQTHPDIKVIRKTLTEIHEQATLGANKELKMYDFIKISKFIRH